MAARAGDSGSGSGSGPSPSDAPTPHLMDGAAMRASDAESPGNGDGAHSQPAAVVVHMVEEEAAAPDAGAGVAGSPAVVAVVRPVEGKGAANGTANGSSAGVHALRSAPSSEASLASGSFASVQPPGLGPCPEESASFFSFTYLIWLNSLFAIGAYKTLEDSDVPRVRDDVSAAHVSKLFRQKWREQLPRWQQEERIKEEAAAAAQAAATAAAAAAAPTAADGTLAPAAASTDTVGSGGGGGPSKSVNLNHSTTEAINYASYRLLYRTLYAMYGRRYWLCGFLKAAYDATNFAQPILLAELVTHIRDTQNDDPALRPEAWRGYVIATGMLLLCAFGITMTNIFQRVTYCVGLRCRTALITALYRKSFRLSPAARAQMSTGQIVNMMSVDASLVDQCCAWMHFGYSALIQLIVAIALLVRALGPPALVGVGVMLFFVPFQTHIVKGLRFARRHALKFTDQRIKLLNEILVGIRVIKVYAWEGSFLQAASDLRSKEMHYVRQASFIRGRNATVTQLGPILMALGSFIVLGATGGSLDPANVFSSVVYFNLLRMPLMQIPNVMNMIADAQIGLHRIQKFLLAEELADQPTRLTAQEAEAETQKDREAVERGAADPEVEAAYRSLMTTAPPTATGASNAVANADVDGNATAASSASNGDAGAGAAPAAAAAAAATDPFAIKLEHCEWSWDVLPEQIVKDDPAELAAAASGRGGRGGRGGGGGGRGAAKAGRGDKGKIKGVEAPAAGGRGGSASGRGLGRGGATTSTATAGAATNQPSSPSKDASQSLVPSGGAAGASDPSDAAEPPRTAPSVLFDITLCIPAGKLTLIVGSVGSGKTSLLCGLLGEMRRKRGSVSIAGSVGYCAQQAWIMNSNLRNNVLFGKAYDPVRYQETVRVCALTRDLKVLPDGDRTEIGEKGINLSGGQKQRVNLARALYFDSDIVLMDDPLSAVDAHVSKYLFHECIQTAMKGKTRVLVTHQLQYAPQADYIVFLKAGRVHERGTYETLMARPDGEFAHLFRTYGGGDNSADDKGSEEEQAAAAAAAAGEEVQGTEKRQEAAELAAEAAAAAAAGGDATKPGGTAAKAGPAAAPRALMTTEERAQGGLGLGVWIYYFKAFGGVPWVSLILTSVALQTGIRIFNDYWLAGWTDDTYNKESYFYIAVYGALGVGLAIALCINIMLQVQRAYVAARRIHDRSLSSLLRAPMRFFDTTPVGRVLNRFSRDQDIIDNSLSDSLRMLWNLSFNLCGMLVMMCFVQPWFTVALAPILYCYWYFQKVYRRVNREVKRMDSTSRSPLFSHFSETLSGLPTIRAYAQQHPFVLTNADRMDNNNRFYFLIAASQRWLGTRMELMGGLIIFSTAVIASTSASSIPSGLVGLSLSYAMQVTQQMSFFLRQIVETENYMNSVERAKYYTESLPHEAAASVPAADDDPRIVGSQWPDAGRIDFEGVSMRYRDGLKLVLDQVSFSIAGGTRVGIVGRTGAGKSSLMVSLFRLVELSAGRILLDGVDIAGLGLDKLRRSMAIIPQDPVLYSGTVRTNLDPFGDYTDEQIWAVLSKSHLDQFVSKLDGQLGASVAEGGENFSVGQRSQVCLARAMLRNAKVLIMDEATASVDMQTDALIQESLRTHFKQCTILTIAHRLATIMDYDKVMVLDFGKVAELDSPANLLRRGPADSLFAALVAESGSQSSELLMRLAFDAEAVAQGRASAGAANDLQQLEQSVWRDPKAMAESSVSHRRRRPATAAAANDADGQGYAPAGHRGHAFAVEEEVDELSMVRFHEHHAADDDDDDDDDAGADRGLLSGAGNESPESDEDAAAVEARRLLDQAPSAEDALRLQINN